jgi:biotin carboxylase
MKHNRILILGAGEGQVPLIQRAKNAGCYVIVVSPNGNYPGFAYADECAYADISNAERILEVAKQLQIHAIATDQTDVSISSVQYVAQALNLSCIKCDNIENFRYKSLMREICYQNGIPTIRFCSTNDISNAIEFYNTLLDYKAIVKPVDSQGSRGVTVVQSLSELQEAFSFAQKYSKSQNVIIEQFIEGQEIEIDTVVKDRQIIGVLVGDVHNFTSENAFSAYERIYPSMLYTGVELEHIKAINETTIRALGLITGWAHGEYIVSKTGEIYLLEVGARGGGNYIGSDIVKTMLGVGTDEMAFETAIGDESFYDKVFLRDKYCAYKCFYLPEGNVESVDINWQYFNQSFVLRHNLADLQIGLKTAKNTDKTSRYTIVIEAESKDKLRLLLDEIPNHINIKVSNEQGLQFAIWK